MSAHLMLVVEDTFEITERGVVIAPMMLDLGDLTGQLIEVELRRPDGTTLAADARWRPYGSPVATRCQERQRTAVPEPPQKRHPDRNRDLDAGRRIRAGT